MKIILFKPNNNIVSPAILAKVDSIFLQYQFSQFLDSNGNFTGANLIKNDILKYKDKKPVVSVRFGAACGNWVYSHYPYVEMREKPIGKTEPEPLQKFPVPYDPNYLEKVRQFLEWLSIQLKDVLQYILYMKVGGMNQFTHEIRMPDEDYTGTENQFTAQMNAAGEWLKKKYAVYKVANAFVLLFTWHSVYFPDTLKIPAIIPGLTGFPCIDHSENICDPMHRPHLDDTLITNCKMFNFGIQTTAWNDLKPAPKKVLNAGLLLSGQLEEKEFNQKVSREKFAAAMKLMYDNKVQYAEIYQSNALEHNDIFQQYRG